MSPLLILQRAGALRLLAFASAGSLLIAGCTGDTEPGTAATAPTSTQPAVTGSAGTQAAGTQAAAAVVNVRTQGDLAPHLVGPDGMTLYLFTDDTAGASNCSGSCIENWPPLTVPDGLDPTAVDAAQGELGVIERADGLGRQVTYDGRPLYYWAQDQLPGDTTGHEVGGVWFVVRPTEPEAETPSSAEFGY